MYERPEKQTVKSQECICQIKEDLAPKNILRITKLRLVVPVLLYGCETWRMVTAWKLKFRGRLWTFYI